MKKPEPIPPTAYRMTDSTGDGILELLINIDPAITPHLVDKFIPDGDRGLALSDPNNPHESCSKWGLTHEIFSLIIWCRKNRWPMGSIFR
ncbi:MAG: hypothetical protein D4R64_03825 [Porphyromonadaceae bacterium]|nr:MAG: hypothetical protein D4R64_03825 [Porphyromonadaceae bacterium]